MKIYQMILPSLTFGDAIGNDILAIDKLLKENGYDTKIFTKLVDPRIKNDSIELISSFPFLDDDSILLLHFAGGDDLMEQIQSCKAKIVFRYHNITPAEYFLPYDAISYSACTMGRRQLKECRDIPIFCIADSEFNKQDLINNGYTCPIEVNPILVPFQDYEKTPNQELIEKYKSDGKKNILFVGRIAPNKHQEDIARVFAWYKKHLNNNSRLFFVGTNLPGTYTEQLKQYIEKLYTEDIILTGSVPFSDIIAYYIVAEVFLCMSTHEGFCIPLIEAMKFHVPVIAREVAAVPETMGGAGVLLPDNDPVVAAMAIDKVMKDKALRDKVIALQDERLEYFSFNNVSTQLIDILEQIHSL